MPTSERRARILEHIQQVGGASLAELAREHAVSTITVHRDLEQLSRQGLVVRFHGGARAAPAPAGGARQDGTATGAWPGGPAPRTRSPRTREGWSRDGETIFLDATSTAFALAHRLERSPRRT